MRTFLPILGFVLALSTSAQVMPGFGPVFPQDEVTEIHLVIDQDSLIQMIDNLENEHEYPAQFVFVSNNLTDTVDLIGLRLRGNTSLGAYKKSFKIEFDAFDGNADWQGLEKMNLLAQHNDPSMVRSKLCHDALRQFGIACARTSYTRLYINEVYHGLYLNVEQIDEEMAELYFDDQGDGNVYKCTYPATLEYAGDSPSDYNTGAPGERPYDLQNNLWMDDYSDFAQFVDVLNNSTDEELPCSLPEVFDVEDYLIIAAMDVLTGNWDNYIFLKNNFFLYHDQHTGQMRFIPYDMDNTLGLDWLGINWTNRDIYHWEMDGEQRPLYQRLLEIPEFRERFSYHINKICDEFFNETNISNKVAYWQQLIDQSVQQDPFYPLDFGFSYDDFLITADSAFGGHVEYGIIPFVSARRESALAQTESFNVPGAIVHWIAARPVTDGYIIEARITGYESNECSVLLSADGSSFDSFPLTDSDGPFQIAGDGIFSYYSIFPPQTQDKVFFKIQPPGSSNTSPCEAGFFWNTPYNDGLYINEVVISNTTGITDEAGQHEDWIELYNSTGTAINLTGKFITDDFTNPNRFILPSVSIPAYGYELVWLDRDMNQGPLHATFKLSAGESLFLFTSQEGELRLADFAGPVNTSSDIAWERVTDGGTPWAETNDPTPGASNTTISAISEYELEFTVYPNPASDLVRFSRQVKLLTLTDACGRIIMKDKNKNELTLSHVSDGLYYIQADEDRVPLIIRH